MQLADELVDVLLHLGPKRQEQRFDDRRQQHGVQLLVAAVVAAAELVEGVAELPHLFPREAVLVVIIIVIVRIIT